MIGETVSLCWDAYLSMMIIAGTVTRGRMDMGFYTWLFCVTVRHQRHDRGRVTPEQGEVILEDCKATRMIGN